MNLEHNMKIKWEDYPYFGGEYSLTVGEEKTLREDEIEQINESFRIMNQEINKIKPIVKAAKSRYMANLE